MAQESTPPTGSLPQIIAASQNTSSQLPPNVVLGNNGERITLTGASHVQPK
ncbi:MAG: hypothetical protein ACK4NC_01765 [Candidatus Gracilibacteria bacterium]